jgi:hypothetical protein
MKKFIVTISFVLAIIYSHSQNELSFSKVIQTDSIAKTNLFIAVNDWFATNYKSANDVIQMADKEAGTIIGKGTEKYNYGKPSYLCYDGYLNYTVKVYVKDNRFKVDLTNFVHKINLGNAPTCELGLLTNSEYYTDKGMNKNFHNNTWKDLKTKAENISNQIFKALEENINSTEQKSDW